MNLWTAAAIILLLALLPCLGVCLLAADIHALAAVEIASTLLTCTLMVLAEAFHRQPFIDLAITFAVVAVIGSLAFARMLESEL